MAVFVVMEPPAAKATGADAAFVRDGFAPLGFLMPYLWLFWHRLWLEGLIALGALSLLAAAGEAGLGVLATAVSLLIGTYVGLEGAALRVGALRRRGWREAAVVVAAGRREAELRYYADETEPGAEAVPSPQVRPAAGGANAAGAGPALGLLAYPGGR